MGLGQRRNKCSTSMHFVYLLFTTCTLANAAGKIAACITPDTVFSFPDTQGTLAAIRFAAACPIQYAFVDTLVDDDGNLDDEKALKEL